MKLKVFSVLAVMGLLLAASGTAEALTIPTVGTGIKYLASYNQDNGTAYVVDEDHAAFPGWAAVEAGNPYDPDALPAWVDVTLPRGRVNDDEDTWGIFILQLIRDGKLEGNTVNPLPISEGGVVHYSNQNAGAPKDTWLVGMFWGGEDRDVSFEQPGGDELSDFTVVTDNVHMEMWAVEMTDLDPTADIDVLVDYVAANRTAANRYTGWLDGLHGQKLLSGVSTYVKFDGAFHDNLYFSGDTNAWFDVDENDATGLWNWMWGTDPQLVDDEGNLADLYLNWGLQRSFEGWDTYSRDFGGVNVIVPEPLTMLGMFLGIGGLSGYLRKRQKA